ncbi:Integral membrane protein TerC family protein [Rosistilla carotiformis]|uniref:Integral membrane protein TerC family protein n=1 Tax=Rosistilla carotiformis TaxID=2528017 RepID=A0A518JNY3_9BACT|nr:TerC family protein [Rosistilla carotiformis]QDV67228.1 Integral membrane protein TerC family protein [Rosistilla carotiformis]
MIAADLHVEASGIFTVEALIALVALTLMEIVLGIDNIVFIAIKTSGLPEAQRPTARRLGLLAALVSRIVLLLCISWIVKMEAPLFHLSDLVPASLLPDSIASNEEADGISVRDGLLFFGGLFLLWTGVREIHDKIEHIDEHAQPSKASFGRAIATIAVMDIVFSIDSVITAVGMADQIWVMVAAVIIAVGVMIAFANQISDFVENHPTIKMLALSFLILIGVVLVTEAVGNPLAKGYVYFAMGFSLMVEFLNMRFRMKQVPSDQSP